MKQTRDFLRIPVNRIIALILVDIMSIVIAAFGALYVRFDFSFAGIPPVYIEKFEHVILPNIIITLLFFTLWKLYKSVWRYASANELLNIIFATSCAAVAQTLYCHTFGWNMPRIYYVIYWFILTVLTCGIRFGYRILRLLNSKRDSLFGKEKKVNVMVIGAGAAGNMILKEIESSRYLNLQAKCIIDDQPGCHGKLIRGIPIVGGRDKILDAAVSELLVTLSVIGTLVFVALGGILKNVVFVVLGIACVVLYVVVAIVYDSNKDFDMLASYIEYASTHEVNEEYRNSLLAATDAATQVNMVAGALKNPAVNGIMGAAGAAEKLFGNKDEK